MPPLPAMKIVNPYTIVSTYLSGRSEQDGWTGCSKVRLDMAVHAEIPTFREPPEWRMVVREDARQQAICALWAIVPRCRTIQQITKMAELSCRELNHFVLSAERIEFEEAFRAELQDRLEVMAALGRR
jgi:hypothetical protein